MDVGSSSLKFRCPFRFYSNVSLEANKANLTLLAVENSKKMEKTGCRIIPGAPTTLAVKRLMLMMMMTKAIYSCNKGYDKLDKYKDALQLVI